MAECVTSSQEAAKDEIRGPQSVVDQDMEERRYLEVVLTMAREWALKAQVSLSKFQESQDW